MAVIYSLGGYPAPSLFSAALLLLCWVPLVIATNRLPPHLVPKPNPTQQSVFQVLSIAPVWSGLLVATGAVMPAMSFDPIITPILTGPPYMLSLIGSAGIS